jgi:hypothetical protein
MGVGRGVGVASPAVPDEPDDPQAVMIADNRPSATTT